MRAFSIAMLVSCVMVSGVLVSGVWAADEQAKEEKEPPRTGNIAGSTSTGQVGFVGADAFGEERNDITGSVSKVRPGRFVVRVFNNSDTDTFSASFELKHLNAKGDRIKSETFNYSLAPKKSAERTITTGPLTDNMMLDLTRVRSTATKKKEVPNSQAASKNG